jgi:hypothetical protein
MDPPSGAEVIVRPSHRVGITRAVKNVSAPYSGFPMVFPDIRVLFLGFSIENPTPGGFLEVL